VSVQIRRATVADVRRCTEVWASTQSDLDDVEVPDQPLLRHEIDTGCLMVAELDGNIIGFGSTFVRSGVMYLADLFVEPGRQGHGAGRELLHALCGGHDGALFTFSSEDPRAQHLYEQAGMRVIEPYHYLDAATIVPWPTDVELIWSQGDQIATIDATLTGRDRAADIDFATGLGATWYVARRDKVVIGAVALTAPTWWNPWHPGGMRIGPVVADDPDDTADVLGAAMAVAAAARAEAVSTFAPASLPALPALLGAGFEIVDTDLLMATDDVFDRSRYLPTVDTP